ncbi:zinc transporter ZIP8-like [Centruroides sculpturatus]|uniref:zinc transporter ZIP8-like n=1 Tax=Centruroides sculpturatus TaxID=218467 RepID=UPI000C6CC473|nr:zinc transporter ZIP8-like [Centruroides sculpturatus]XP_023244660.1 zinc transporter ZIP8-like [Centruroides sculpturatus]
MDIALLFVILQALYTTKAYKLEDVEASSWQNLLRSSSPTKNRNELINDFTTFVRDLRHSFVNGPNISCLSSDETLCNYDINNCLSPEELFDLLPNTTETLNDALNRLCPVLLSQMYQGFNCHHQSLDTKPKTKPSAIAVWGLGILCITVISACSLVGVLVLPVLSKNLYKNLLMLFEGLAVGSLASSAVFHLIPQAFNLLGQDAEHDYLWKAAIIFSGIYVFFLSEHLMKIVMDARKKRKHQETNIKCLLSHKSFNVDNPEKDNCSIINFTNNIMKDGESEETSMDISHSHFNDDSHVSLTYHNHDHNLPLRKDGVNTVATVAWMIIFGDGFHNFIDGLSIGAAFSESILAGISISVAVVCEEFPHELGDFAVLINAGMSMKQALIYNFMSACTCYIGFIFGVVLGDLAEGSYYIFAFAGGMFLYISLVDMMGELNDAIRETQPKGVGKTLKVFLLQNIGILIGVVSLFVLARYSEKINFDSFYQTEESLIS